MGRQWCQHEEEVENGRGSGSPHRSIARLRANTPALSTAKPSSGYFTADRRGVVPECAILAGDSVQFEAGANIAIAQSPNEVEWLLRARSRGRPARWGFQISEWNLWLD